LKTATGIVTPHIAPKLLVKAKRAVEAAASASESEAYPTNQHCKSQENMKGLRASESGADLALEIQRRTAHAGSRDSS